MTPEPAGHVFVSYSHDDRRRVDRLVAALAERGVDVRWDAVLRPGDAWDARLTELRASAAAVLVVWSVSAATSAYVTREAAAALAAGTYVPATLDGVDAVPADYRTRFTVDLSTWAGGSDDAQLGMLVQELAARVRAAATGPTPEQAPDPVPDGEPALPLRPGADELLRFAFGVSRGSEVGTAHVVLAALLRLNRSTLDRTELAGAATTALHRALPAPAEPRIRAALVAAGVDAVPGPEPVDVEDTRVRSVLEAAQAVARRLGATELYSHHVVGAALTAAPLPDAVLAELGVTQDQLRAAFRAGIARRWPDEPTAVWDGLLGPVRDLVVSDETTALWGWAAAVRWARGAGPIDDTDIVLGALAAARADPEGGSAEALYRSVPASDPTPDRRLDAALAAVGASGGVALSREPSTVIPTPTTERAAAIAARVSGSPAVGRRHLLAAALTGDPLPEPVADALGVDGAALRNGLADYLARTWATEPAAAWEEVLNAEAELGGDFSAEVVSTRRDATPLQDHLRVEVYVGMLATLIAREGTKVPLSIGLFGEWGSGKSYFMELLRERITTLAVGAAADRRSGTATPYHAEILQIRFNAWHYADTNLWASLATEFFDQLTRADTDTNRERREKLERKLADEQRALTGLEAARTAAEKRTAERRTRWAEATAARERKTRQFSAQLLIAVAADKEVSAGLARLAAKIGFADQHAKALQLANDLQGIDDDLTATRRVLARRSLVLPFVLLAVVTGAIALALAAPETWTWVPASTVTAVGGVVTTAGVLVGRARQLARELRGIADKAQEAQARVLGEAEQGREKSEEAEQAAALAVELHEAETAEALARTRVEEAMVRIAQLDRELVAFQPGRRLHEFLAERAASTDYRGRLGVVSLVRRDFEQLVTLMADWDEKNEKGEELKRIDRIVLYIDDLDRCEPDQVVTVLQAVHLLLAMDLFVVVVGVDPRWLLRSLSRRYQRVLGTTATADERDAGFTASTPQNYLEKIFQVPFVLPGMNATGFAGLLTNLALPRSAAPRPHETPAEAVTTPPDAPPPDAPPPGTTRSAPGTTPPGATTPGTTRSAPGTTATDAGSTAVRGAATRGPEQDVGVSADLGTVPGASAIRAERNSELTGAVAKPIDGDELVLLTRLAPLVRTPRAATRLFNVYSLVRSTRNLTAGRFLGRPGRPGDHQAVAQLLGVLTAAPELFGPLLWGRPAAGSPVARGLCRPNPVPSWKAFVAALEPQQEDGTWRNGVVDELSPDELASWRNLRARLQEIGRDVGLDDVERYRWWAPKIARFSFLMSPFTADEPDAPAAVPAGGGAPTTPGRDAAGRSR